ncbi:hypothetical protein SAMN02745165_02385 [Malonomonas rubra DSM 5091]|uniref:Uncharacterized protein n=1 Tax=Malonomonas rubra DSM 5091 TaxID=1122189 RepID=A0A1M6JBP6_MALRU|nr:hypothetical protein SAMN02745165_02385 [Malonomonas rubra DSM 5091]
MTPILSHEKSVNISKKSKKPYKTIEISIKMEINKWQGETGQKDKQEVKLSH